MSLGALFRHNRYVPVFGHRQWVLHTFPSVTWWRRDTCRAPGITWGWAARLPSWAVTSVGKQGAWSSVGAGGVGERGAEGRGARPAATTGFLRDPRATFVSCLGAALHSPSATLESVMGGGVEREEDGGGGERVRGAERG